MEVGCVTVSKVEALLQRYRELGWKLRTAESCTAGGIAARIGSVPGASAVLERGWVTYSNEAKFEELAVDAALIAAHGAVSREVVEAMARGGAADDIVCIAVSGIAGPDGGTPAKPVGTVWIAIAMQDGPLRAECFHFTGDRAAIQQATIDKAIDWLADYHL